MVLQASCGGAGGRSRACDGRKKGLGARHQQEDEEGQDAGLARGHHDATLGRVLVEPVWCVVGWCCQSVVNQKPKILPRWNLRLLLSSAQATPGSALRNGLGEMSGCLACVVCLLVSLLLHVWFVASALGPFIVCPFLACLTPILKSPPSQHDTSSLHRLRLLPICQRVLALTETLAVVPH